MKGQTDPHKISYPSCGGKMDTNLTCVCFGGVQAGNTLSATLVQDENSRWKGAPVMSTMMFIKETVELEQFLSRAIEGLTNFEATGSSISLISPSGTALFEREDPVAPELCTQDFLA